MGGGAIGLLPWVWVLLLCSLLVFASATRSQTPRGRTKQPSTKARHVQTLTADEHHMARQLIAYLQTSSKTRDDDTELAAATAPHLVADAVGHVVTHTTEMITPQIVLRTTEQLVPDLYEALKDGLLELLPDKVAPMIAHEVPAEPRTDKNHDEFYGDDIAVGVANRLPPLLLNAVVPPLVNGLFVRLTDYLSNTVTTTLGEALGDSLSNLVFNIHTSYNYDQHHECYYKWYDCQILKGGKDCSVSEDCAKITNMPDFSKPKPP
eukprot:gnl/Spiro4/25008_TR12429_c0_g1_i1.p1 gnl/Spiro4/25008_TR12429_c0_g1~~gnl/Spiro4/25008_TR12429_c0_g1_i1.p1  ORF type:complete len:264 (+),score=58.71 gnl/Spiro4/25008_TR12429_c0_g1_i1:107-898(+)